MTVSMLTRWTTVMMRCTETREMVKTVRNSKSSRRTRWSSRFTTTSLVTSFFETSVTSRRLFWGGRNTLILSCSFTAAFSTGNILKAETWSLGQQSPELGWLHSPFTVANHHKGNSGGSTTTTNHSTET